MKIRRFAKRIVSILKTTHLLFAIIYLLFIVLIFFTYKNYGVSTDEAFYLQSGAFYSKNFFNTALIIKTIPSYHLVTHGAFFDFLYYSALLFIDSSLSYESLHLVKAMFASLTLLFVYLIVFRLTKKVTPSVVGVLLLIFLPRWYGDIFDNHMDPSSVLLYAMLIYTAVEILLSKRNKKIFIGVVIFFGISALAYSHRPSLFLFPLMFMPFLWYKLKARSVTYKNKIFVIVPILVFFLILILIDPYVKNYGIVGFIGKGYLASQLNWPQPVLFNGSIFSSLNLPRYYLPYWILVSTPIITLLFYWLGTFLIIRWIIHVKRPIEEKLVYLLLLSSMYVPIIVVIAMRPVAFNGWRHYLFLIVPLIVIATLGVNYLLIKQSQVVKATCVLLIALQVFLTGKEMRQLHPYEYVYFNSIVGGLYEASDKFEADYWNKSNKEAISWLKKHLATNKVYAIKLCQSSGISSHYFSKNMTLVKDIKNADILICRSRGFGQDEIDKKFRKIFFLQRKGVEINSIKQRISH